MTTYERSVDIAAPASTVVRLLHDLKGWARWTSTILEATPLGSGVVQPGARVRARQPGLPVSVWTVDLVDDEHFEWNNLRHGLRTVATHLISPTATGCRLTVTIRQDGLLVPVVSLGVGRVIRRHLVAMTEDIKKAAQSAARAEALHLDLLGPDAQPDQQLGGSLSENR